MAKRKKVLIIDEPFDSADAEILRSNGDTVTKRKKKGAAKVDPEQKVKIEEAELSENDDSSASEAEDSGNLFASVPDSDEVKNLFSLDLEDINETDSASIEEGAIAALPHAEVEPELLLYDNDDFEDTRESPEENEKYEEFLFNYRKVMEEMLDAAKKSEKKKKSKADEGFSDEGDINEFIVTEDADEDVSDDEDELISIEELTGGEQGEIGTALPLFGNIDFDALDDGEDSDGDTDAVASDTDSDDSEDEVSESDAENEQDSPDREKSESDEELPVAKNPTADEESADGDEGSLETDTAVVKNEGDEEREKADHDTDESASDAVEASDDAISENDQGVVETNSADVIEPDGESVERDASTDAVESGDEVAEDTESSGDDTDAATDTDEDGAETENDTDTAEDEEDNIFSFDIFGSEKSKKTDIGEPLNRISLREYVPYLNKDADDDAKAEDSLSDESADAEDSELDGQSEIDESSDYLEDEFEYESEDPEQLEIDFGEDDSKEETYTEPEDKSYDPEHPRAIDNIFDIIEMFVFTFVAVIMITSFFIRHSIVNGSSMEQTLFGGGRGETGDVVLISDFLYEPQRGDIVVFDGQAVPSSNESALIKRVIAVAGDTVRIETDGRVFLNGELLEEDYVYEDFPGHKYKAQSWTIGEGEIFVLGDHRNVSNDSEDFGPVSVDSVLGKVLLRIFPFDRFGFVE